MNYAAALLGALAITAALSACSGHPGNTAMPRKTPSAIQAGTVRGIAAHCAGPLEDSFRPVTVSARLDGRTVAKEVVRLSPGGNRYRLRLMPGRYQINAAGSNDAAQYVVVQSRQTITLNFPNTCD